MAGRYYLARIVGSGTRDDPYRAATRDLGVSMSASIPTWPEGHPQHGHPRFGWALVHAPNDALLVADADHIPLPAGALTAKWATMPAAVKQAALAKIHEAFGLTLTAAPGDTLADVVNALGVALDGPHFHHSKLQHGGD